MLDYTNEQIYQRVDHTLLAPDATIEQIIKLCNEAKEHRVASICINPCYIPLAKKELNGEINICTVVGFPLGANTAEVKAKEASEAVIMGANEIDMVINIGLLKSGCYEELLSEIKLVKSAVGNKVLKVIIETCLLTESEKRKMCQIVEKSGADFIKTSTGFSKGGATFEDIELFYEELKGRVRIKAAGGIRTREDMEKFISLGADRLGTSSAVKILNNQNTTGY